MKDAKSVYRVAKRKIKSFLGQDFFVKPEVSCSTLRLGSTYGGWTINPDLLNSQSIVYSVGVGEDISFDLALIEAFKLTVEAFDPTPRSIQWVKGQQLPSEFRLHEYGLADFDGDVSFEPPSNPAHISHRIVAKCLDNSIDENSIVVPVLTLNSIMSSLGHQRLDLLKMDIEGSEYSVINYLVNTSIRPRQLLIEFHHRFVGVGIQKTQEALFKLKSIGYDIFSVSESGEEISFLFSRIK
jgi:FkbM family methyltransferase